jgi:hypothetical protein
VAAREQIASYEANVLHYHGFPELYNEHGKIYTLPMYKSVHATGWIVNFEQARDMIRWTADTASHSCPTEK